MDTPADTLLSDAKEFKTRTECGIKNSQLYQRLRTRNLLEEAFGENTRTYLRQTSDEELLAEAKAKNYCSRNKCYIDDGGLYRRLRLRGLLDQVYGKKPGYSKETPVQSLLADAKEYGSKRECRKGSGSLYQQLYLRKLLSQAFPKNTEK